MHPAHWSAQEYADGIRNNNRVLLGRAITLLESTRADHQAQAEELIRLCLSASSAAPRSFRVGITGAPGVGKSTFIDALGIWLVQQGHRVAVLAVDPSSSVSRGSILGDKTRMERLSTSDHAFIRPSPSGTSLGGVARKTRESILLVESAGYDVVLVETVGVGQSEIAVHSMTDAFVLLLLPGAGDELQGIKRGIVEMADLLVVNKADGDRQKLANQARAHYLNATHLLPSKPGGYAPQVLTCSALEGNGIETVWQTLLHYQQHQRTNGYWEKNRQQQAQYWMQEHLEASLHQMFYQHSGVQQRMAALLPEVLAGRMSPFAAADQIMAAFTGK